MSSEIPPFPADFVWGVATASYQIEGAANEDGRKPSIWDTFSHTPGKVKNGDTGDVACDHYHRWQDDIEIIKQLNVDAYRLSIAWPRILPDGRGAVNQPGLDFYSRLIDGLLDAGITPYVTLYHWDLPQALQDEGGGWLRREIYNDFVNYADGVVRALGDRVKHWTTFNEPYVAAWPGYYWGVFAPGLKGNVAYPLAATHHMYLAHGHAVDAIRAAVPDAQVGMVLNLHPAYPHSDSEADKQAAHHSDVIDNHWYLQPLLKGGYPDDGLAFFKDNLPDIRDGDMDVIKKPLDYIGVNYYYRKVIQADASVPDLGFRDVVPTGEGVQHTDIGWEVYADGLLDSFKLITDHYDPIDLYVTESGAAINDGPGEDGAVHDQRRVNYLKDHFTVASQAITNGIPLKGYFVWSLMDNFEWAQGYSQRFGVTYVNYETQERTIKDSGHYLAQVATATKA